MELDLREGFVEPELAEEFPELGLVHTTVEARPARSPPELRARLRRLADRYTGGRVVHMRQDAVPWAYRVFWRQVGIDPDKDRTPAERVAVERLQHGGFRSDNTVDDALTIAVAETGVGLVAFDGDLVGVTLGLRLARSGEWLEKERPLPPRQIVIADERRALAVLVGEVARSAGVTSRSRRVELAGLRVKGVPKIAVEEALWLAAEVLMAPAGA
jgi:DNA/RNA-binding domain of Phe-tRNA-synthetase-like protein